MESPAALTKGAHITEKERNKLGKQYAKRYKKGESIRAIAEDQGRSFGFVYSVLKEHDVELRARGTQRGQSRPRKKINRDESVTESAEDQ